MGPAASIRGWPIDRHRAGRQEPAGCVLAALPLPPPFTVHIRGAMERAEADHAKADQIRMARDVATMFDELKALADRHAEMHADRARLQAGLEQARAELARARRPWWRRLIGR
jgi:hypothetical protein